MVSSGKTILLAGSAAAGRSLLQAVTTRVLGEAPGLELWGVVVPVGCPSGCAHRDEACRLGESLALAHGELAKQRAERRHPAMRGTLTPFTQPCTYTGAAAVADAARLGGDPVSAQVLACAGQQRESYPWPGVQQDLAQELGSGWVGVLHADGNGLGAVFQNLHKHFHGSQFLRVLSAFSAVVDAITREAVRLAAEGTQAGICADAHPDVEDCPNGTECQWWLPVVVGGDDVTALVRGDVALGFTGRVLSAFEHLARSDDTCTEVTGELAIAPLTMSAGLAFVKPKQPFNQAYGLAEQLCSSAKDLPPGLQGRAALDVHVLYDSIAEPLTRLRRRSAGPAPADGQQPAVGEYPAAWEAAHQFAALEELVADLGRRQEDDLDELRPPIVSASKSHAVRSGLLAGGAGLQVLMDSLGASWQPRALCHDGDGWKTDWIDALALGDVAREAGA